MANLSDKHGVCPIPFMQESLFPSTGGYVTGRWCGDIAMSTGNVSCCLPCPQADWRYSDGFIKRTEIANWISVCLFVLNGLMLISFGVLPVKYTQRHYLSVCFVLGISFMSLSFIVPLGSHPKECFNEITPHDMTSDLSCASSGALIIFGGWCAVMWSFCRAASLHLQICWDVIPGKKFFYGTMIAGWGLPAVGLAVALILTGTSYRFGSICHINHENSVLDFWGPLMIFAAASLIIQLITMAYCTHVYIKSLFDTSPTTDNSSALPSYSSSVRTVTARQAYRRVRRVMRLQWRGIAVVLTIIGNVIFFTVIFLSMDRAAKRTPENLKKAEPWILCLVLTKGDRNACASRASALGPDEPTIMATLILLSLSGIWTLLFLGRISMIGGWVDLVRRKVSPRNEFVSADARRQSVKSVGSRRAYEMFTGPNQHKSPEPLISPTASTKSMSTYRLSNSKSVDQPEYYNLEARYTSPALSFSTPRPPSATHAFGREWNPQSTFARGGSGGSGGANTDTNRKR